MNKNNQTKNNFINVVSTFTKDNFKTIIVSITVIFFIFLSYQVYSYYNINKLNNISISYFKNKEIDDELIALSEFNSISNQSGFYSILSKLELINKYINKNEFDKSIELYNEILSSKGLDSNYVSIVAIKGAYQLIDIVIKNNNNNYINDIKKFISSIDAIQILSLSVIPGTIALLYESKLLAIEKSKFLVISKSIATVIIIVGFLTLGVAYEIIGLATTLLFATIFQAGFLFMSNRILKKNEEKDNVS